MNVKNDNVEEIIMIVIEIITIIIIMMIITVATTTITIIKKLIGLIMMIVAAKWCEHPLVWRMKDEEGINIVMWLLRPSFIMVIFHI